jgi:PAS domain S-box-containing protein
MVYISSQAEQITGYSPEQLLDPDFDFHQVFDNLQLNENESVLQHFFKISNASLHMKVDVNCLSGKKRNCCLAVRTMPFQGRKAYLGIISDLTDFQAVNKKLDETKERYWALFEASSDAIFIETLDGTILDCNSAVEKLYGYKKDELLGMTARDLVPGNYSESLKAVAEELSQAESAGKTLQIMATGKKKDGTIFPTEVLVNELKIDNDDLFLVTIRDISLRKELESARKKYDGQMQQIQLLDSFTNVVSGLANDFNNILTGIMGYSDLIMREISPNSPIREKNRRIQEAARKGADIINQLIASTGKLPANFKKADLKTLIRDIIGQLTARVEAKGPLTCVVDKNLPEIVFDSSQIKLALNNLVLNAFEATDKKGHFSIQVAAGKQSYSGDEPGYFGPPFKSGSYVSIKVSDQGCGISAEVFNQIFEPFFSTCNSRRGLGLSTVLGIVRSHRGAIFIKSEVQTGTEIQLLLPVRNFKFCEDNSEFEIENGEILEDFPAGNALIIDDEQSVLDLICEQLKNLGFNTFTAINGKQGIELFKLHNHCLDIVVLDLALPGKTGFEVFQEFEWLNPKIPVIICTGMVEFSQELKHCNNCVILNKPFQSSDLEKALFKARTLK